MKNMIGDGSSENIDVGGSDQRIQSMTGFVKVFYKGKDGILREKATKKLKSS